MAKKTKHPENESATPTALQGLSLNQLVDYLPCYITIQDRDLRLLYVNQRFKQDFGDGVGKKCHTVYKCSDEICPNCPVQKTFEDRRMHLTEENVTLASGGASQVLIQTSPIIDKNGVVTAVIELATNITRLKRDRKELVTLGQSIALLSQGGTATPATISSASTRPRASANGQLSTSARQAASARTRSMASSRGVRATGSGPVAANANNAHEIAGPVSTVQLLADYAVPGGLAGTG